MDVLRTTTPTIRVSRAWVWTRAPGHGTLEPQPWGRCCPSRARCHVTGHTRPPVSGFCATSLVDLTGRRHIPNQTLSQGKMVTPPLSRALHTPTTFGVAVATLCSLQSRTWPPPCSSYNGGLGPLCCVCMYRGGRVHDTAISGVSRRSTVDSPR